MTAPNSSHQESPRIAVALANPSNGELLERLLGQAFHLKHGFFGGHESLAQEVDLVVIDVACLRQHYKLIRDLRRRANPMVLPVLLVVESRGAPHPQVADELGKSVDDILRIPTSQVELQARINNLLRLRTLAREQDDARRQLVGVVSALRTLSACDSIVVRSESESELIRSLCQTIVDEDGYNLAWIGFNGEQSDSAFEICAWAGPSRAFVPDLRQNLSKPSPCADTISWCIRTNTTHVVNDIADTLPFSPPERTRNNAPACCSHHAAVED